MKDFCDRLVEYTRDNNLKQVDIVRITGSIKGLVSQWFSGKAKPGSTYLTRLSEFSGKSVSWWLNGRDGKVGPEITGAMTFIPRKIPIISWVQAGSWADTYCDNTEINPDGWIETSAKVSTRAFALVVRGDSMTNHADPRSIQDGSKVIVDPEFDPAYINRKIVVAMLDGSTEATIKEFVQDGPSKYLNPLNSRYPVITVNGNCRIVGVVKQIVVDL